MLCAPAADFCETGLQPLFHLGRGCRKQAVTAGQNTSQLVKGGNRQGKLTSVFVRSHGEVRHSCKTSSYLQDQGELLVVWVSQQMPCNIIPYVRAEHVTSKPYEGFTRHAAHRCEYLLNGIWHAAHRCEYLLNGIPSLAMVCPVHPLVFSLAGCT